MRSVVRVVFGYAFASLAAAASLVMFVYTPAEIAAASGALRSARLSEAGIFVLVIAPYLALFAALPALAAATIAELRGIATWGYHATVGVVLAAAGFLIQHFSEGPGQPTILHNYALVAFLTAGLVGGTVYWLLSGRHAVRATAGDGSTTAIGATRT